MKIRKIEKKMASVMVNKYNALIVVRGVGVKATRRIENKPMPFIINKSKELADEVNMMAYKAIVDSVNIKFKRVK